MKTIGLTDFNRGIKNDPRSGAFRTITNFDVFTDRKRAIPYYDSESGDSGASSNKIQNFCVALGASSTWRIFGLGVVSGQSYAKVFLKEGLTTGGANDLDDAGWTESANNASSAGATSFNLFVYYKKTGYIYGARAGTHIWRYDPDGGDAWVDSHQALTYTNISQGLVHSKNDIMYLGADNYIVSNDNGSWNVTALTLPSNLYITSICEFGNYLAIAAAPLSGVGRSYVFLWDMVSASWNEMYEWGSDVLKVIEDLEGTLVGISIAGGVGDTGASTRTKKRVSFRYLSGNNAIEFENLISTSSTTLHIDKQRVDNRVYFLMQITLNGTARDGLWSLTRNGDSFALTHERTPNNDTPISTGPLNGFIIVGDYVFISYVNSSAAYAMSKTNDTASYTHTSVIETSINPNMPEMDKHAKKKLMAAAVSYDPLPSGGQVVLKYKVDGGSWVTIFTATTAGEVLTERSRAVTQQFTDGREYEFAIEATGGAAITGLYYKYDLVPTIL